MDNGSVSRVQLKLRAYHPSRDPQEVTDALGVDPDRTQSAGTKSHFPELGPVRDNGWFLTTTVFVPSDDLGDHVRWFVEFVRRKLAILAQLRQHGWELDVLTRPRNDETVSLDDLRFLRDAGLGPNQLFNDDPQPGSERPSPPAAP